MGLKDRRRRRQLEAARFGDDETPLSASDLSASQTYQHVLEHQGAVALKAEQLLVLLAVSSKIKIERCAMSSPML